MKTHSTDSIHGRKNWEGIDMTTTAIKTAVKKGILMAEAALRPNGKISIKEKRERDVIALDLAICYLEQAKKEIEKSL
jgi:hypothetical protein